MKRIIELAAVMALVITFAGTMASCGDDDFYYDDYYGYGDYERADALIGTWQGRLSTYYQAAGWVEGDYVTYITFNEYGRGIEVDYDDYTGYRYTSSFSWGVDRGVIYIRYDNRRDFRDVYITDYTLGGNYFDGYMYYDNPEKESQFRFDRISAFPEFYGSRLMNSTEEEGDSIAKKP